MALLAGGMAMPEALASGFAAIEGPRCGREVEHRLVGILVIAVGAAVGEAESLEGIAPHGRRKRDHRPRGFPELRGGTPSHGTFRRAPTPIDPERSGRCFLGWVVRAVPCPDAAAPRRSAIGGKAVRRSFDRQNDPPPLRLLSAPAVEHGPALARRAAGAKRGELSAPPGPLDGPEPRGRPASPDAPARRPEVAARLVAARGGDQPPAPKANRKRARAAVREGPVRDPGRPSTVAHPRARARSGASDEGHGRWSVRRRVLAGASSPARVRAPRPFRRAAGRG